MLHAYKLGSTTWWRFSAYEIRDGYICPARGAKLNKYDPWELFERSREKRVPMPYSALVGLVEPLQPSGSRRPIVDGVLPVSAEDFATPSELVTPEVRRGITEWCSVHGLLGLLLHRVRSVRLAYRLEQRGRRRAVIGSTLFYANHGWQKVSSPFDESDIELRPTREAISTAALPGSWPRPSAVARMPLTYDSIPDYITEPMWREEPLSETWTRYFPGVPAVRRESFNYPVPTSPQFWSLYGEPLDDFLYAALMLSRALVSAAQIRRYGANVTRSEPGDPFGELNELTDRCSLCLEQGPNGSLQHRWASPSLIDKLAMMAALDLGEGRQAVGRCTGCGRLYPPTHHRQLYCSKRCQGNNATRTYRKKLRGSSTRRGKKRQR